MGDEDDKEPTGHEPVDEAMSSDPAAAADMAAVAAYGPDYYLCVDDEDDAEDWCDDMAEASGMVFVAVYVPEIDEVRCGPADDMGVLTRGSRDWETCYAASPGPEVDEAVIARRARSSRMAAKRKTRTTMNSDRRRVAARAKKWRLSHKSKARRYAHTYREEQVSGDAGRLAVAIRGVVPASSVPDIRGMPIPEAVRVLREAGLTPAQAARAIVDAG